jgi:hypothetical protein
MDELRAPLLINGVTADLSEDVREAQAPPFQEADHSDQLDSAAPSLSTRELTDSFLRLGNLDNGAFDRLGRYNAALWKQTLQTLLLLQSIQHR